METGKLIFGFILIGIVIYMGVQLIPPYYSNYEFEDFIRREALESTYKPVTENDIREHIMKSAKELDIPITDEQLNVVRTGSMGTGTTTISANYTVHIGIPFYPFDLHFNPSSLNRGVF